MGGNRKALCDREDLNLPDPPRSMDGYFFNFTYMITREDFNAIADALSRARKRSKLPLEGITDLVWFLRRGPIAIF